MDRLRGREIPPALIGQDGDVAGDDVGDRQVDAAVILEVARRSIATGVLPDRDRRQDLERAVAVIQEDGDVVARGQAAFLAFSTCP